LEAFAAAIRGEAPFAISDEQIIHGVAVFEAIVKSANTGSAVKVS
jgi:predicted dehydrogenase